MTSETLSFRPHARLLTMLGEQLIKDERIALIELIKNAYDADASCVQIRFENFNESMTSREDSRIVVRDDGCGMKLDTLRREWMNPATPTKFLAKRRGNPRTPHKGRVLQGEKGIGRFAVLKLGHQVTIATRARGCDFEAVLTWDFGAFDDDFFHRGRRDREVFLDEVTVAARRRAPKCFTNGSHGTEIDIRNLRSRWGRRSIALLSRDLAALTDPISRISKQANTDLLQIEIYCNGKRYSRVEEDTAEQIRALIEEKAVLQIHGRFDSEKSAFTMDPEGTLGSAEIPVDDPKMTGLWVWRQRFGKAKPNRNQSTLWPSEDSPPRFACGGFAFHFFVFDFARALHGRYTLNQAQKNLLKKHRIYLYRDGVRVYPYGNQDDDWLEIDVARGTGRAGNFLSNDQTIGWIAITHEHNQDLRDKTNREGLIGSGGAADDLIFLAKLFLSYVKQYPFARYRHKQQQRASARLVAGKAVAAQLADLQQELQLAGQARHAKAAAKIAKDYSRERHRLVQRAEVTEDLAGVGLSVEMASHDIMLLLGRGQDVARELAHAAQNGGDNEVVELTDRLIGVLQQVVDGMSDVQTLFQSSRRRRKHLKIGPLLKKIYEIYKPLLSRLNIRYDEVIKGRSPLVASSTDGVVMQVLINLFDNAAYWLAEPPPKEREVVVTLDGDRGELIFADSGPGIDEADLPYIFDAFYSGKGQEGRGLGLYIARQLLERHDYRIDVAAGDDVESSGATFIVSFVKEGK